MMGTIILTAFLLRLVNLNQSLWLDEGVTARVVNNYSLRGIVTQFSPHDFHPPFYYLLMKLWTDIFGSSEISLRLPSVLFSLAAGYIIYLIGREIKDKKTGLLSAAIFLFNPLIIYYAQEARMYSLAIFFIALTTFYLLKKQFNLFLLIIFSGLAFLSFYGTVFYLLGVVIYLYFYRDKRVSFLYLIGLIVVSLPIFPLLIEQFSHSRQSLIGVANWASVLGKANLKNLLLLPVKFSSGRISFQPKIIYYFFSSVSAVIFFLPLIFLPKKKRPLLILVVVPLLISFLVSFKTPLFSFFRLLYLLVPLSLLVGLSLSKQRYWQKLLLLMFITWSLIYLFLPQFHREDWKSLSACLPKKALVYGIPSSLDALSYYRKDLDIVNIRSGYKKISSSKNYYVVPYTFPIYGINRVNFCLTAQKVKEKDFRGNLRLIHCQR